MLKLAPLLTVCLLAAPLRAQDADFQVDKNHTHVGFTARHLGLAKVRGEFKKYDATVKADRKTARISSLKATIQSSSVDTANAKRDKHLRSDDFFATASHPTLSVHVSDITWKGNDFKAVGRLTIRGITREVEFRGTLLGTRTVDFGEGKHLRAAYEVSATISRKAFGLKFNGIAEGISIVGDKVEITIEAEIARQP